MAQMKDVYRSDTAKDPEGTAYIGVAELALGIVIIVLAAVATELMIFIIGIVLIVRGALDGLAAYRNRYFKGYYLRITVAIFSFFVGLFLILFPQVGISLISLIIASLIVLEGIRKLSSAFVYRGVKWGYKAIGGILSLALGVIIFSRWPVISFWLLGTLVGIELVLNGWVKAAVGFAQKERAEKTGGYNRPAGVQT